MRKLLAALCFVLLASTSFAQSPQPNAGAPVSGVVVNRSTLNSSVTIAAGNTFQTVLAAQSGTTQRQSLTIQNNNASDSCWIFIGSGSAAKAASILLASGQAYTRYWPYVPSDAIQATCATTSDSIYIDNQ